MSSPSPKPLTIWCNAKFSDDVSRQLEEGLGALGHRLVFSEFCSASVLDAGKPDPLLATADVALGQPDVAQCMSLPALRWIEVTTAGYTRYDREDFQDAIRARAGAFTNASQVFAEPCAQHVLAMMLAFARQLLPSHRDQLTDQSWHYSERRYDSRLLNGETVLMLGYGTIARRLAELLAPFGMKVVAVRRRAISEPGVHIIPEDRVSAALAGADHIVNLLSDNETTRNYVNARRLSCCKSGAKFYNIGRGTTVDHRALIEALESGRLAAAYLDVFETEPLPPADPLWTARNCYITPHTAGGRRDQDAAIVRHFLENLAAWTRQKGGGLIDRIV
ncbi:phosphoglycerate dehydrogenase-like enzyme [Ereboglobus sp. PH5-5]|uniref:D-2-hydroxyacid dehydrogenase n=1 Tax=Ereboglobus sp. PH5-5 TaxID=2940529 RepID=UPI002405FA24|nr:D-2-hydroxyacid dehydrogenase [Ereboglobus sp. PH5-5]MDF9833263.1 phosphoglycerate dehydrogenase-like enzyme [Ereboglobus sp. PH5-5]